MIAFDVERMNRMYQDLAETNQGILKNMKQIEQFVYSMEGEWQGDAQRAFAGKILYIKEQFQPLFRFLQELTELLKIQAELYEEQEDNIRKKLNAL